MEKYTIQTDVTIPQDKRAGINEKILYLVTNNMVEKEGLTPADVFNCYTGHGGLHGLARKDFGSFHEYTEAKKAVEQGQFFTPHPMCRFLVDCLRPTGRDIIYDLACGMGNFFNYLPAEGNIYGTDTDIKALKIARYLYPLANLAHEDIRTYKAPVRADLVLGNPPFNIEWDCAGERTMSQMYFCKKAAGILKPAGLMAVIVPHSFLQSEFSNKADIETISRDFDFVAQFGLPADLFTAMGADNFKTKVLILQKKSRHTVGRPYSPDTWAEAKDSGHIYRTYIQPLLAEKERLAGKLYFECRHTRGMDKDFMAKVTKYLYDIKRHPKLCHEYGKCESRLHDYLSQEKPPDLPYAEWEKTRIKGEDVLTCLKSVLSSANKVYRDEKRTVKTKYTFFTKDYSGKEAHGEPMAVNDCILNGRMVGGYQKLLRRKAKEYRLQSMDFGDMAADPHIESFLKKWTVHSTLNNEDIRLTGTQAADTNKLLQKRYGILQYSMGSGKTLCGLAMAQYHLLNTNIKNVFVVGTAIAVNNTWDVVMKDYGIGFKRLRRLPDIAEIQDGQIVLLTLDTAVKLQKRLKGYIRSKSQKAMLLFDESDAISNPFSKRTKAMLSVFRRCRYKYLTTGTTTRNNICEIAPQLELLYNNSINYLSLCGEIFHNDKDGGQEALPNPGYGQPVPAYRAGYELFAASHLPEKITVFGIGQKTQDIYNAGPLKEILDRTVITKNFEEVTGKDIYEINQIAVPFHPEERRVYIQAIKEFEEMRRLYFSVQKDARKDSMLKILQQLILLLKVCADPSGIAGYSSPEKPTKVAKVLELLGEWKEEKVAIGARHVSVVRSYARYIAAEYPGRPLFIITGSETSFRQRRDIIRQLGQTKDGILISTQQALSASTNIDFVDKVLLPELHYNNAAMSQYYFRFIRFTSKNRKQVCFLTYKGTIESNLLKMVLVKEKFNLFMKNEILEDEEIYERFGVDPAIIGSLMSKEYDEDGRVHIRWGEQTIA